MAAQAEQPPRRDHGRGRSRLARRRVRQHRHPCSDRGGPDPRDAATRRGVPPAARVPVGAPARDRQPRDGGRRLRDLPRAAGAAVPVRRRAGHALDRAAGVRAAGSRRCRGVGAVGDRRRARGGHRRDPREPASRRCARATPGPGAALPLRHRRGALRPVQLEDARPLPGRRDRRRRADGRPRRRPGRVRDRSAARWVRTHGRAAGAGGVAAGRSLAPGARRRAGRRAGRPVARARARTRRGPGRSARAARPST